MYLPYLRGKQFDFIAMRDLAPIIPKEFFKPIIEPVRENLSPLIKTIKTLNDNEIEPIVIVNPSVGHLRNNAPVILSLYNTDKDISFVPCIKIYDSNDVDSLALIGEVGDEYAIQITGGVDPESIAISQEATYTIIDEKTSPVAIPQLKNVVLIGDSFDKKVRNADYKIESAFSHAHITSSNFKNVVGFGDYTILPEEFVESGGPAYVVTIHASYINTNKFNEIYIRHYSSYDDRSPANPAGKFIDALNKLVADLNCDPSIFYHSNAMREFESLHSSGHYPGLGQVKKMSIKHHIETVCNYLVENS